MTLNLLQCQIKQLDEYSYFSFTLKHLFTDKKELMMDFISKASEQCKELLNKSISMKRININAKNGQATIGRRILKAKKPGKE